jgi:hypothetical protein
MGIGKHESGRVESVGECYFLKQDKQEKRKEICTGTGTLSNNKFLFSLYHFGGVRRSKQECACL